MADADARVRSAAEARSRRDRSAASALLCLAGALALLAYSVEGVGGMLVMLTGIVALGSVMVVAALPSAPAVAPSRRRPPRGGSSAYRSYDRVARDLSWADVSARHYDTTTRPMLQRLLAARLLAGHGINLSGDPESARRLVGDDLWSYLDPARPVNPSSQPPGIDPTTLARIIDRLEQL